ncbi:hypothetical protein Tco_1241934 [Tanacetum coccineum]
MTTRLRQIWSGEGAEQPILVEENEMETTLQKEGLQHQQSWRAMVCRVKQVRLRIDFPLVEHYVINVSKKFGIAKARMN